MGRAVASRLGQLEYRVAITGRTEARLEEAVRELRESGVEASGFLCDLSDERSIASLFDGFRDAYDKLDVQIYNSETCTSPRQAPSGCATPSP